MDETKKKNNGFFLIEKISYRTEVRQVFPERYETWEEVATVKAAKEKTSPRDTFIVLKCYERYPKPEENKG